MHMSFDNSDDGSPRISRGPTRLFLVDEFGLRWEICDAAEEVSDEIQFRRQKLVFGHERANRRLFVRTDLMTKKYQIKAEDRREPDDIDLIRQFREAEFIGRDTTDDSAK